VKTVKKDVQILRIPKVADRPRRPFHLWLDGAGSNNCAEVLNKPLGLTRISPVGDPLAAHHVTALGAAIIA
jgi:hypothetical protein